MPALHRRRCGEGEGGAAGASVGEVTGVGEVRGVVGEARGVAPAPGLGILDRRRPMELPNVGRFDPRSASGLAVLRGSRIELTRSSFVGLSEPPARPASAPDSRTLRRWLGAALGRARSVCTRDLSRDRAGS